MWVSWWLGWGKVACFPEEKRGGVEMDEETRGEKRKEKRLWLKKKKKKEIWERKIHLQKHFWVWMSCKNLLFLWGAPPNGQTTGIATDQNSLVVSPQRYELRLVVAWKWVDPNYATAPPGGHHHNNNNNNTNNNNNNNNGDDEDDDDDRRTESVPFRHLKNTK